MKRNKRVLELEHELEQAREAEKRAAKRAAERAAEQAEKERRELERKEAEVRKLAGREAEKSGNKSMTRSRPPGCRARPDRQKRRRFTRPASACIEPVTRGEARVSDAPGGDAMGGPRRALPPHSIRAIS